MVRDAEFLVSIKVFKSLPMHSDPLFVLAHVQAYFNAVVESSGSFELAPLIFRSSLGDMLPLDLDKIATRADDVVVMVIEELPDVVAPVEVVAIAVAVKLYE